MSISPSEITQAIFPNTGYPYVSVVTTAVTICAFYVEACLSLHKQRIKRVSATLPPVTVATISNTHGLKDWRGLHSTS